MSASTSAVSPTIRAPRAAILTPRVQLVLALGAVYIIWGSTYLAMRWAVEGIPPLFMGAARFLIAGAVLLTVARLRGVPMPTAREWRGATIVGGLFFLGGNGLVAIAERDLGSGIAAVVCATMPVWLAVMASIAGERPRPLEWLGLGTGLIGVVVLTGGADVRAAPFATAVLVLSPISWALGSLLSRKVALPRGLAAAGAEMLAGGALLAVAGIAHGERIPTDPPTSALLAVVYLIVAGSLIGFTAYAWLLRNARPAVATSYAFVNPALALVLGAVLGAETIGPATLAGTALIIVAVAVIVLAPRRAASTARRGGWSAGKMMKISGIVAALALLDVGCGSARPATTPPAPTGPAPALTWDTSDGDHMMASGRFAWTGLPAVAADGSAVLLPMQEVVAGPEAPNLTLVEKGRDDRELGKLVVMTVDEASGETAAPKDLPGANRWLAERHQARDWQAMVEFARPEPTDDGVPDRATHGDVAVAWAEGHLTVTQGGATVVDGTHADWLAAPYKMACGDACDDMCENPSMLASVVGDLPHRLLVVTIGYHGTDTCWEPSPQVHVVAW